MKKVYEAPAVEKIAFQYRDQVVVASGNNQWVNTGSKGCTDGNNTQVNENTPNGTCVETN